MHVATVKVANERAKTAAMMELNFIVIESDDVWCLDVAGCVQGVDYVDIYIYTPCVCISTYPRRSRVDINMVWSFSIRQVTRVLGQATNSDLHLLTVGMIRNELV